MLSILHTWRRPFIRPIIFNYRAFHCLPWPNLPSAAQPLPITLNFIWHWTPKNTKRLLLLVEKKWIGKNNSNLHWGSSRGRETAFCGEDWCRWQGMFSQRGTPWKPIKTQTPLGDVTPLIITLAILINVPLSSCNSTVLVCWFSCLWHVAYWCIKRFCAHEVVIFINRSCSYVSFFFLTQ